MGRRTRTEFTPGISCRRNETATCFCDPVDQQLDLSLIGVVLFKSSEDFKFRRADIDVSQEANESMDQAEPSQSKQYGQFQNCSKGVSVAEGSQLPCANQPTQCSLKRSRHIKLFEFSIDFFCATFGAVKILFHGAVKSTRRLLSIFHQCDELGDKPERGGMCRSAEPKPEPHLREEQHRRERSISTSTDQRNHIDSSILLAVNAVNNIDHKIKTQSSANQKLSNSKV